MLVTHAELVERFRSLEDEELLRRSRSGDLTELAQSIARSEIERRGLNADAAEAVPLGDPGHGSLQVVARFFAATDAYLLKACLESNDIPAVVADAHLVQANQFLTTAVGGVRVMVPKSHFERALRIQKAFDAGEYRLDDDFDVGQEIK